MNGIAILQLIIGLALLILGAEMLVRGASRLAAAIGISPLIIGLTVVAFGTSSPELAVSLVSAWTGQADIAVGNVVGSNIFNILVIIGLSALIVPLVVAQQLVRLDVPLMIGISFLSLALGWNGYIGRGEGAILFGILVIYLVFLVRASRRESAEVQLEYAQEFGDRRFGMRRQRLFHLGLVLVGLVLLVVGSRWLVAGAVALARWLGVSELVIGLTIVAGGTSLPEVATSVVAALRKERDIAVGNAVGSNIFNLLAVLGLTALVAPQEVVVSPAALVFDFPVMIAVAVATLPIFFTGYRIARWEGALFLGYYIAYVLYLFLNATQHDALPAYSRIMLWFVIPLTVVTILVLAVREWHVLRKEKIITSN
ncbi:MAG: calcium/sodium antiporter [Caldilineales bacterium]|nr:calcium/sodium antiporter [Caldilineales bacterium]